MALRTINEHAAWTAVLGVLNVPVAGRALPARTTCPLCRGGRLTVYEDTISGGAWHYCFDCYSAGDMIELASAAWGLSPQAALAKMSSLGVGLPAEQLEPAAVAKYVARHPQTRNRMRDLWRRCMEHLATAKSAELTRLKQRLRIDTHLSPERWRQGPGNLVGGLHSNLVAEAFAVDKKRTFRGRGWGEVLAVPYHDLPERICAFLLVGRGGGPKDMVFRVPGGPGSRPAAPDRPEAGLAGLWSIDASRSNYGPHVFAVDDAFFAARLQVRHFATSTRPLPLIAWYDGPRALTRNAWGCLDRHAPVFWGWDMTAALLSQAMRADGLVAITPLIAGVDDYVRKDDPADLLRKALKRARPWKEALKDWIDGAPDAAVEEVLAGLRAMGHDPEALVPVAPRVGELLCVPASPPSVRLGTWTVMEQNGQWWGFHSSDRQKVCIMNARLRIDGVLVKNCETFSGRTKLHDIPHYRGRLLYEGDEIPFEVPMKALDNNPTLHLPGILARAKGKVLYIASGWAKRLIQVAKLFQIPDGEPGWPA